MGCDDDASDARRRSVAPAAESPDGPGADSWPPAHDEKAPRARAKSERDDSAPQTLRHAIRAPFLALVAREPPLIAALQRRVRSPFLDKVALGASFLGTHTVFLVGLPLFFWCDQGDCWKEGGRTVCATRHDADLREWAAWVAVLGRSLVVLLALSCYFTGSIKDFLFLPRPPSPPVHRLTLRARSAIHGARVHEEFGLPSTHSSTALATSLLVSWFASRALPPHLRPGDLALLGVHAASALHALAVPLSRLYCGFHGPTDVAAGLAVGAALFGGWVGAWSLGGQVPVWAAERWLAGGSWAVPITLLLLVPLLVSLHGPPHPSCPCFDDSLSFLAVLAGVLSGGWFWGGAAAWGAHVPGAPELGKFVVIEDGGGRDMAMEWAWWMGKVAAGTAAVVAWRLSSRAALRAVLPRVLPASIVPPPRPASPAAADKGGAASSSSSSASSSASEDIDPTSPTCPIPDSPPVWTTESVGRVVVYWGVAWTASVAVPWGYAGVRYGRW